jgi:alanine dehydrogenase
VIPVISQEAVLTAVSPAEAIERTRDAFERHAKGEWVMPAKVYLDSPPGDFRAMPARGSGVALLKWVTSYPDNPKRDLPVVTGVIVLSDADTGAELAIVDARSVTWLRTGAAAAVSAEVLAVPEARTVGIIGCGVNGAWAARCLKGAGYRFGVCHDRDDAVADALAQELGWLRGAHEDAAAADIVVTCTPGEQPVLKAADLHEGQHIAALGADAHGKAELERNALRRCHLFCDEWEQASGGGELSGAAAADEVSRGQVTQLGEVLIGAAKGRESEQETTLFDSTGLAIQDLGICLAVLEALKAGRIDAQQAEL